MSPDRLQLAVVGAAECDAQQTAVALEVGRRIALAGADLLCGGRGGVMAAAAEGARRADGRTIGILPGSGPAESPPNPHIETVIYSGMGQARNQLLVLSAAAVIAVGGGWGTLSEIALALKQGIPVIGLGSWRLERPDGRAEPLLRSAASAEEAVALACEAALSRRSPVGND